jgi:hypothetical protein
MVYLLAMGHPGHCRPSVRRQHLIAASPYHGTKLVHHPAIGMADDELTIHQFQSLTQAIHQTPVEVL